MLIKLFNFDKALQAAAVLLRNGKMRYSRLLKLLYLSNRKCLQENATLIIFDRAKVLRDGPILKTVHNIINGKDSRSHEWNTHLHTVLSVGTDSLSSFECGVLKSVHDDHFNKTDIELTNFVNSLTECKVHEMKFSAFPLKNSWNIPLRCIVESVSQEIKDVNLYNNVKKKLNGMMLYN